MIRRKIWASLTCITAISGVANAQSSGGMSATLGKPQVGYTARGAAPTPASTTFVPNYTVPTAPTYSSPVGGNYSVPFPSAKTAGTFAVYQASGADQAGIPMTMPPGGAPQMVPGMMPAPTPVTNTPGMNTPVMSSPIEGCLNGNCAAPILGDPTGCGPAGCNLPHVWIAPEYLRWSAKGMKIPVLVSTAPSGSPGTLDAVDTTAAYGGGSILDAWRSGFRVRGGLWLDKCGDCGIDVGFFMLGRARDRFIAGSNGDPGVFRPFFNAATGAEDAQLVAFTDPTGDPILRGRVTVNAATDLWGGEINHRSVLCCDPCNRIDLIFGYRYMRLRDTLSIREDLVANSQATNAAAPFGTQITVFDRFETINDFHGGQIGITGDMTRGKFTFGYRASVALGVTHQKTKIAGSTSSLTPDGDASNSIGGLLAQSTNIGSYTADRFSVVPEVGLTLGYQLNNHLRIFGSYNFLYWTNVLRAGEQIDRTVNANFIPNPDGTVPTGVARPAYNRAETDYWMHGWSVGLEWRW